MRRTLTAAGVGLGLLIGTVGGTMAPASAETDRAVTDRPVTDRLHHDLDVMAMRCAQRSTLDVVVCEWRPTEARTAVGYQLWRIVDRGDRELVWRGGLDTTRVVDEVPADAKVVRYAVLAIDESGRIVGRSRPVRVKLEEPDRPDRPVRIATDRRLSVF